MSLEITADKRGRNGETKLIPFPRRSTERRVRHELEFLPAALEIIETPTSAAGRIMMGVIVLLVVIAIAWACFGQLDIVATATGRIIPVDLFPELRQANGFRLRSQRPPVVLSSVS